VPELTVSDGDPVMAFATTGQARQCCQTVLMFPVSRCADFALSGDFCPPWNNSGRL